MFQEPLNNNYKKTVELERLHEEHSFDEILEESDLTEEEVVEILYDLGYLKLPPYLLWDGMEEEGHGTTDLDI